MIKRVQRLVIGLAIGVAVIVIGIWLLSRSLEEQAVLYQGKSLTDWCEQLKSREAASSNQASVVLNTQIIPQLIQQMFHDTNDSSFRLALIEKLNALPGVNIRFTPADGRRANAASCLGEIGPPANTAVPALIQALTGQDDAVRDTAATALGQIHCKPELTIPALLACLNDPQADTCAEAAEALGSFGDQAKAAVPQLVKLLEIHTSKELMRAVPTALKKIDPEAAAKAGVK